MRLRAPAPTGSASHSLLATIRTLVRLTANGVTGGALLFAAWR